MKSLLVILFLLFVSAFALGREPFADERQLHKSNGGKGSSKGRKKRESPSGSKGKGSSCEAPLFPSTSKSSKRSSKYSSCKGKGRNRTGLDAKLEGIHEGMGTCGGYDCPCAVIAWHDVNMAMHVGMMALDYTGEVEIDFARGMIPHHQGAVDMCEVLFDLEDAECSKKDPLGGIAAFCEGVVREQTREIQEMKEWLQNRGLALTAPCMMDMHMMAGMNSMHHMMQPCGNTTDPSSMEYIELNKIMMMTMAIDYSCDSVVDFVRQMIPHHQGAVDMCDILLNYSADPFLTNLCDDIITSQTAEIALMSDWLNSRGLEVMASCGTMHMHMP